MPCSQLCQGEDTQEGTQGAFMLAHLGTFQRNHLQTLRAGPLPVEMDCGGLSPIVMVGGGLTCTNGLWRVFLTYKDGQW